MKKGRAAPEQKPIGSQADARNNFSQAREIYQQAAARNSPHNRRWRAKRLHAKASPTSSYWLDDYQPPRSPNGRRAYPNFDDPAIKSYMLYRIGLSQQRMGQFGLADQSFASVQQQYPGTDAAKRAREHQGFKSFTLQLATFASGGSADSDISKLQQQGVRPTKSRDSHGNTIIAVGPFSSYSQALGEKLRFSSIYPQAVILP